MYLRRSYRDGGKVKHEQVANLSTLPEPAIAAIDAVPAGAGSGGDAAHPVAAARARRGELTELEAALGEVPPEAFLDDPSEDDLLLQRTMRQARTETQNPLHNRGFARSSGRNLGLTASTNRRRTLAADADSRPNYRSP